MYKEILINGEKFRIDGVWLIEGNMYCYKGVAEIMKTGEGIPIHYRAPVVQIEKEGKEIHEQKIEKELIKHLQQLLKI